MCWSRQAKTIVWPATLNLVKVLLVMSISISRVECDSVSGVLLKIPTFGQEC